MRIPRSAGPAAYAAPAVLCAAGLLAYAAGKAYYATQGRLGVPGGPTVPASAYEQLGHVALRQWTLATAGLVGALLVVATVVPRGGPAARWVPPRWLLLTGLWGALVPLLAGAPFVVLQLVTAGSEAVGGAVHSVAVLVLWLTVTCSYQQRSRQQPSRQPGARQRRTWARPHFTRSAR